MTQYIDKAALISEIIDLKTPYESGWNSAIEKIIDCIDDLEVKDVDLEKELVAYLNENFSQRTDGTLLSVETGEELTWYDYEGIAKHFFELGLKTQKGE